MCRERKPSRNFSMNKMVTIVFESVHNCGTNMAAKCARIGKKTTSCSTCIMGNMLSRRPPSAGRFTIRWEDRKEIKQTLTVEFRKLDDEAGWDNPGKEIILNNYWMRLSMISWIIKTEVWHEVLIIYDIMRKPNSIIVLLYIFHIIHPQK